MAIRQSVLALYGAVSEGLDALNRGLTTPSEDPRDLRTVAAQFTGLTGSAGERGWYGELLRYFDQNRIGDDRVTPPTWDDVIADLTSTEEDQRLTPMWAHRAIEAAYVLDRLADAGVGPRENAGLLALAIAAAPAEGAGQRGVGRLRTRRAAPDRVGIDRATEIATSMLQARINHRTSFWEQLQAMSGTLATAVTSIQTKSRLRKVKREYCSVVSTTAEWPDISYAKLKSVIEPANWSSFYDEFFCAMQAVTPDDDFGWSRIRESVSGDCARYRLDTALKFWKEERSGGLFLNYDMDADRTGTDPLVLVDNGYIGIRPIDPAKPGKGVKVRTSKQLLISGMSATAMTKLAETLGWAGNATDMFYYAAHYDGKSTQFAKSQILKPPQPDTSTTWPVVVPCLPPDLRGEYLSDATEWLKKRFDFANDFSQEFAERWKDGLDLAEIDELNDMITAQVKTAGKEALDTATDNFRPKAPTP